MRCDLSIRTFLREVRQPEVVSDVVVILCVAFICAQIVRLLLEVGAV